MSHKQVAFLLRIVHGLIVLYLFSCIGYIYYQAVIGNSNLMVWIAILSLITEGIIIFYFKGTCPFIFVQSRFGDTTPFFDLFLPHHYAKYAVKCCAVISIIGIVFFLIRIVY